MKKREKNGIIIIIMKIIIIITTTTCMIIIITMKDLYSASILMFKGASQYQRKNQNFIT